MLCLHPSVMGTSRAKQLGHGLIGVPSENPTHAELLSPQSPPYSAHLGLELERRIPAVPLVC